MSQYSGSNVYRLRPPGAGPLATGGGGTHDGDMEPRIAKLEDHVGKLREDVAVIRERMSHVPTNADLLKVVSSAQWKILSAIALLAIGALLKWAWPYLFK